MKAMVLKSPGKMSLEEVDAPRAGGGNQVLVQVTHTGVCGTDLEIFRGRIAVRHPLIMGHEIAGKVAEPGTDSGLRAGDRVVVDPMIFCGACFHCRIGQTNLCTNGALLGRDADGGFAEYVAVPARNVFRLPASIPNSVAPLIQVTTTCVHSQNLVPISAGESVAVLGLGVTGQIQAQLAKARGASPVIAISRGVFKRELAKQLGTDITLEAGEDAVDKVLRETEGRGADLVIESTGRIDLLADAIKMTRIGGRILLFGIYTAQEGRLPFYELYYKELSLFGARAARSEDFDSAMALVERGALQLAPLVTHVLPLAEIERAIEMNHTPMDRRLKVIVDHES
jgi:2-desacetyl-2-hydroxyethyl bacteriochlorophyllide A dehydrogenase